MAALMRAIHIANIEFNAWDQLAHLNEHDSQDLLSTNWLHASCDSKAFAHQVRASLRLEQWATLSHRRPSFQGMLYGVDRAATMELHRMVGGLPRYHLRCVLSGGVATALQKHRRNPDIDPQCRCCGQAIETLEHLVDECETLDHIRFLEFRPEQWHLFPPCLRFHGIMPAKFGGTPEDRKYIACLVQHTLTDMWQHVRSFDVELPPPVARWKRQRLA